MAMQVTGYNREQGQYAVDVQALTPPQPPPPPPAETPLPEPAVGVETVPESAPVPAEPSTSEPDGDSPDRPMRDGGFQRRIKALTSQKYSLQSENAQLRAQLALMQQQSVAASSPQPGMAPPQAPQVQPPGRPRVDDYNGDNEAFWLALTNWQYDQREQSRQQSDAQQRQRSLDAQVAQRLLDGHAHYEHFDETLTQIETALPPAIIHGPVKEFIAESPQASAVLHYLATTPGALEVLQDCHAEGARRYLQRVAGQLGQPAPPPSSAPPQTTPLGLPVVQAVPPVRPLTGGNGGIPVDESAQGIATRGGDLRAFMKARGYLR